MYLLPIPKPIFTSDSEWQPFPQPQPPLPMPLSKGTNSDNKESRHKAPPGNVRVSFASGSHIGFDKFSIPHPPNAFILFRSASQSQRAAKEVTTNVNLSNKETDQTTPLRDEGRDSRAATDSLPITSDETKDTSNVSLPSLKSPHYEAASYLRRVVSRAINLSFGGKDTTLYESKPKHGPRKFRHRKTTIIINAQQNCGNTTHTRTVNSHNDSSHVEVKSGDTWNTNNGDGTFTNAENIYETAEGDDTVPPQEAPTPEQIPPFPPDPEPYYTEWVIYIWSWVPCFSWDGWLSGWAAQLTPRVCSQWVWP